ncbi:MAG: helix-turn-helix domain-containing protein, partial [Spirochaetaceae bacterium]|nr:helix-turn-helix domain-containing protein [Spirochaetaceae bacterium]
MNTITEKKKKSIHFTYEDRLILEYYLQGKNHFPKITNTQKLAEILHKSRRTIQREIKRGLVEHIKSDLTTTIEYNADYAQQGAEYEM